MNYKKSKKIDVWLQLRTCDKLIDGILYTVVLVTFTIRRQKIPRNYLVGDKFKYDEVIEEAILRNCTKDKVDSMLESLCLEIA